MTNTSVHYRKGIPGEFRERAVLLFEEAFGQKFRAAIKSQEKRIELLRESFCLDFCIGAFDDGELIGIAGFKTGEGSLTGNITFQTLRKTLGFFSALRAAAVFMLYDRAQTPGELLMDGISVTRSHRGKGVGKRLLAEIESHVIKEKLSSIRLDVIDGNPRARKLYEQQGFVAVKTERFEYLRWLLGFGGATTLVKEVG